MDLPLKLEKDREIPGGASSGTYKILKYVGRGGSGVVYRARSEPPFPDVAIKFFLPLMQMENEQLDNHEQVVEDMRRFCSQEVRCLRQLCHPNIVRVLDSGEFIPMTGELAPVFDFLGGSLNFMVTEFVEGTNFKEYIISRSPQRDAIVAVLEKICSGLAYLHQKQYLHADIKPENIVIRDSDGEPTILDFALYKNFNFGEVDEQGTTRLQADYDLLPQLPDGRALRDINQKRGGRRDLKSLCFPWLDLYQFGLLLQQFQSRLADLLPRSDAEYLELLIGELTDWKRVTKRNANWLRRQVAKLNPAYSRFAEVEEFAPPSAAVQTRQLPGTVITVSPLIERLARTKSFRRLRSINQLTFIDTLYPGAGHRRHLHCLRTYAYCSQLLKSLMHSPRFRFLFTPQFARQALGIALLHDINHVPLLHIFQDSRRPVFDERKLLDLFCDGDATEDKPSIYQMVEDELQLGREQFKDVLTQSHEELVDKGCPPELQVIKSMIDGGVDVDKLAYLEDDSRFTGVSYAPGIDVSRLMWAATVVGMSTPQGNAGLHLGFRERGLPAVESVVMARYWMFQRVYWHPADRAIKAMLHHVIKKLYGGPEDPLEFARGTMWSSEEAVLQYLDEKHMERFGSNSITSLILKDPGRTYRPLITLWGGGQHAVAGPVYRMDPIELEGFRSRLIASVQDYLNTTLRKGSVGDDDLLIDVPYRDLGQAEPIYIEADNGEANDVSEKISPFKDVFVNLDKLAQRITVFISPDAGVEEATLAREQSRELPRLFKKAISGT